MHMSISTAASGCRSPRPSAVGSEVLQAVLDELLKASGRTPPGASSGPRRIDFVTRQRRRALSWHSVTSRRARRRRAGLTSRTKSQSCAALAAEQGELLSNRSSAGFETSAGVSRHSSEQQTERMDFSMILRSSTQPGLRHAVCRRSFYPPLSPLYPLLWLSLFLLVVERNH